jgi:uncharacterized protein (DUF2147 family)
LCRAAEGIATAAAAPGLTARPGCVTLRACNPEAMSMFRTFLSALAVLLALPAAADPLLGLWQTGPDRKDQVAHVTVEPCGGAICGTILRAYDKSGQQVTTPNIGKRGFWDLRPVAPGRYEGRAFVPAHNREYAAGMQLAGNRLTVRGCLGPVCMSQHWKRVN